MRHAIIEKLNKELSNEINTEAQVVYIFVEIRKVIKEHDNNKDYYDILNFFCDWIVHTKLDRKDAKRMLYYVQDFYRGLDAYGHIKKTSSFFPFVMLIVLRRELKLFFKRNNLPSILADEHIQWERYLYLLINIIIDCPLIANSGYIREFRFIESGVKDMIKCELRFQQGNNQIFTSSQKSDFIEEDYVSYANIVDK